jgi:uncharacterized glyoxalase superfamily protein PhnB
MMVCPRCHSEYRDGVTTCADCYGLLVAANPETIGEPTEPAHEDDDLVPVFESGDPNLYQMAKSVLEEAGIEFWTRVGPGRRPAQIFEVARHCAVEAAALLRAGAESVGENSESTREEQVLLVNRSMPPGTIIPELAYPDVREAAAWLCRAFGFRERLRIADHRVQLTLEDASVVAIELPPDQAGDAPLATHGILVRVFDARTHHDRAKDAGARIISPPTDYPFGERQYSALDPAGHRWTFSESIDDVDPGDWGGEVVES